MDALTRLAHIRAEDNSTAEALRGLHDVLGQSPVRAWEAAKMRGGLDTETRLSSEAAARA